MLHQGRIAEMATGEGKTLVATLPLYLNALTGRGAHLVTVNNYLARRDSQWMGHVFRYLGLTVACLDDTEPSSPTAPRRLPGRHHLRHQQRVRLRLPARQHGVLAGAAGPAGARLRHHRRGGLDPHRRGADAAHHLGPGGERSGRQVRPVQPPGGGAGAEADRRGEHPARRRRAAARGSRRPEDDAGAQALPGAARHAEEQAAAQAAQRDRRQAAGPADGARRHRRPQAADAAAADARPRGRALLRARREGPLGPPHRPGRRGDVAGRPGAVPGARHLRGDPPDRPGSRAHARTTGSSGGARSRRSTRSRARSCTSSTSCCRRTPSTRRTWTTWCRKARC